MRVLSFLIRYFSNYYTLHRSDLAARAAPLDPRLILVECILDFFFYKNGTKKKPYLGEMCIRFPLQIQENCFISQMTKMRFLVNERKKM